VSEAAAATDGAGAETPADGERWGCFSLDRASRFIVAWTSGPRTEQLAQTVVQQTRERTAGRAGVGWVSDGWTAYVNAVEAAYWDEVPAEELSWTVRLPAAGVALTQAVKRRQGRRLVRVDIHAVIGEQAALPYAVHIERQNRVLRDRLACLTRKTHAFAKREATWTAAFSLAVFEHNWILPHVALRQPAATPAAGCRYAPRTPAMALGLTDQGWTLTGFLTRPVRHSS
jgi:IS1 family transposase